MIIGAFVYKDTGRHIGFTKVATFNAAIDLIKSSEKEEPFIFIKHYNQLPPEYKDLIDHTGVRVYSSFVDFVGDKLSGMEFTKDLIVTLSRLMY